MLLKSLRTKIALNLVVLLLLSMLLIDLVMLMVTQKMLVDARIEKARLLITALAINLQVMPGDETEGWRIANSDHIHRLMATAGGMCAVVVSLDGKRIYRGGMGCLAPKAIMSMAHQAAREDRELYRASNLFRGIFGRQPGSLAMAAPLRFGDSVAAGGGVLMPMDDIFSRMQRAQHILLIYTLINTAILTLLGLYRLGNLTVKPLQRLVKRAEAYRQSDDNVFLLEKEDNEFSKLSKSLNRMLIHLAQDKEKLQASVHSLEKVNKDLERAQRDLIRVEKLASVGRLSAGIAHEIGNPIGIIKGYLALMSDPSITDEEKADFVTRTASEVERIHSIIQQLLDFARPSGEEQEIVSVHAILADLEEVCRFQPALACMRFEWHLGAERDRVAANARQLRQVFLNLVLNAADAVGDANNEGQLAIRTACCRARVADGPNPDLLTVEFIDNGPGIPEENLTNIFDPFFTTKSPGKGTGLGLSVSFTIIEGLGGTIKAESNHNEGTRMVIVLPLADPPSP